MNYLLTNPIGIDKEIQDIQSYLYDTLSPTWGDFDAYGRAYKNRKGLGFVPEVYKGNDEYVQAYYDDSENSRGIMFFIDFIDHTTEDGFKFKARTKICFMLNLEKIGYATQRQDSLVHNLVVSALNNNPITNFKITGIEKTVRNVFYGYTYTHVELETDMHPLHTFAIIGELEYYLTDKCD